MLFISIGKIRDRLSNESEALKKQIRDLKTLIGDSFDGDEEQLDLTIKNFQRDQERKRRDLETVKMRNFTL